MTTKAPFGRLILVPAPLDFGCDQQVPLHDVLPHTTLHEAARLQYWICENAKSTRAYLKRIDTIAPLRVPIQDQQLQELPVVPLVGPISLMLMLAASGLNGQNFAFVGYLPQDATGRAKRIRALEQLALSSGQTQLFIETPYRNAAMVQALVQTLAPATRLAIGSGLTLPQAQVRCLSARQWRETKYVADKHTPAVFAIGR